jgi:hypothetical protein
LRTATTTAAGLPKPRKQTTIPFIKKQIRSFTIFFKHIHYIDKENNKQTRLLHHILDGK